jgi:hypothetical protein
MIFFISISSSQKVLGFKLQRPTDAILASRQPTHRVNEQEAQLSKSFTRRLRMICLSNGRASSFFFGKLFKMLGIKIYLSD